MSNIYKWHNEINEKGLLEAIQMELNKFEKRIAALEPEHGQASQRIVNQVVTNEIDKAFAMIKELMNRVEALENELLRYHPRAEIKEPEKPNNPSLEALKEFAKLGDKIFKPKEEVKESECRHDKLEFHYMEMAYYCKKCKKYIDLIDRQLAIEKVKEVFPVWTYDTGVPSLYSKIIKALEDL